MKIATSVFTRIPQLHQASQTTMPACFATPFLYVRDTLCYCLRMPVGAQPAQLELSPLRAGLQSIQAAAPSDERILVFNCLDSRDPAQLLKPFTLSGQPFTAGSNGAAKSSTNSSSAGCPPTVVPLSPPGTACMFDHAMFVPGDSVYSSVRPAGDAAADVSWQLGNAHAWEALLGPHHSTPGTANGAKDELRTSLGV